MMIKQVRAVIGAAAAAAVVLGLGVMPVAAATATWTVTPGGKFYTLSHLATPDLTDATTGARFPCPTGFVISGSLKTGTGLADPLGTIATAKGAAGNPLVLQCTGNGLELTVTFSGLPWQIRATRYDSASPGTTSGILAGLAGRVASFSGPSCSAVIDGTAPGAGDGKVRFSYTNNGVFTIKPAGNLHFYNVSGCNGHINNGDSMTYTAPLGIKANGSHAINIITSP
ncbi:MAG TPA: hypothetical protein VFJ07_15910 [Streptosporangiaceae bacterium]|nr:hypothetical protein [Streptosporangiaceae bacterium]